MATGHFQSSRGKHFVGTMKRKSRERVVKMSFANAISISRRVEEFFFFFLHSLSPSLSTLFKRYYFGLVDSSAEVAAVVLAGLVRKELTPPASKSLSSVSALLRLTLLARPPSVPLSPVSVDHRKSNSGKFEIKKRENVIIIIIIYVDGGGTVDAAESTTIKVNKNTRERTLVALTPLLYQPKLNR